MIDIHPQPALAAAIALLETAGLPTADLTETHCRNFFHTGPANAPTGVVGVELHGDVALLRSLAVRPGMRSTGIGSELLRHAEDHARTLKVRCLFLLTTTAERFFLRHGYLQAQRDQAPLAIKSTREFAAICPASSALMSKLL